MMDLVFFLSAVNEHEEPRQFRLAGLCSYLQHRYKHLCRQERAATRHKRYRYAFRKALLHAASKDPDCTGELIQRLSKTSHTSDRYCQLLSCVCLEMDRVLQCYNSTTLGTV